MLARLQRGFGVLALFGAAAWAAWCLSKDHGAWAWAGLPLLFAGYAAVLAVEFLLMRAVNQRHGVAVRWAELLRAWWGEVLCGPRVFGWRQPWRSERFADRLGGRSEAAPSRRGVVLIHGFFCNRGLWNRWLEALAADGVPCIAVNLEPVFGSIDDYVPVIDAAVQRLQHATGLAPVLVGHSMGGLALRRWRLAPGNAARVHHAITLGTPHQGTWLARFALSHNARQMRQASRWLQQLAAAEAALPPLSATCFYTACDNIVFPLATATLASAHNVRLDAVAHVDLVHRPEPLAELRRVLGT